MSGGHFDYKQHHINDIADSIQRAIDRTPDKDLDNDYELSERTLKAFKDGVKFLRIAAIYAQRIDWLLSGDDSEETFHKRLREDLKEHIVIK